MFVLFLLCFITFTFVNNKEPKLLNIVMCYDGLYCNCFLIYRDLTVKSRPAYVTYPFV